MKKVNLHLLFSILLLLPPVFGLAQGSSKSKSKKTMNVKNEPIQTADGSVKHYRPETPATPVGYAYETVPGDPLGVKMYTLKNGLKLILSVNDAEPRINTNIAVRAGSKHDPAETTGLAHYLEHMMFKGTDKIGSLDWEKEKALLQQISDLYEQHRAEKDPEKRKALYAQIDQVSGEAAKLVAANEYDKMVSSLGARGTNAFTSVEQTVYVNDIPSNELERWMKLESERFKMVVLRLFHTELEAVYEEFNIGQDNDARKMYAATNAALFPTHPYGTQTTIGTGEHLKNPSHVKIQEYFSKYYNPNNMAIVLAGDFNPDQAVALAEKYFGTYQSKPIPPFKFEPQPPIKEVIRKDIFGQEAAYLQISWRFGGASSKEADYTTMISRLLANGKAGLIDLNLLQKQQVLEARASAFANEDYTSFSLYGKPREGQQLEDVEKLLLTEIENIKQGKFDDWLLQACIKDLKLNDIRSAEANGARVSQMTGVFTRGMAWKHYVERFDRYNAITKQDIIRFANEHFKNNYAVIYKRSGADPNVVKVEKPAITPVSVNRTETSGYTSNFLKENAPRLEPVFVDFKKEIQTNKLACGVELDYIKNRSNPTFILDYIVEMGKNSDKELALAVSYLPYLGTDKYTSEQLKQEFFRLGLEFNVSVSDERVFVTLAGLDESLEEGIKLFEHLLTNVKADAKPLGSLVDDILLQRENAKKNKTAVLRTAMANYARYGKDSPFTNILSADELKSVKPDVLVSKIKSLNNYEHRIFYYGSQEQPKTAALLDKYHKLPKTLKPVVPAKEFDELATPDNEVVFVNFPMVQAEILLVSQGTEQFNLEEHVMSSLYNNYFGGGLSSIVFQEIRESRALAYSANVTYGSPNMEDEAHYLRAYVGTQVDKMPDAIDAMREIIDNMPVSEAQINQAAQSIQKQIETTRLTKDNIYWSYRNAQDRGFDRDLRKDVYDKMKIVTPEDLKAFQEKHVKGRNYTFLVLGDKDKVDMEYLKKIGKVTELSLDEVFGYGTGVVKP